MIVTQKMFGYCGGLRAVTLLLVCLSTGLRCSFGFSYVLFVTMVTLYHDNVFGVGFNVMINKFSFAGGIKCILSKSVVYVIAC